MSSFDRAMISQLETYPTLWNSQHRLGVGEGLTVKMSDRRVLIVISGSVEILLRAAGSEAPPFCWQTLMPGDWINPFQDISPDDFPEIEVRALGPALMLVPNDLAFRTLLLNDRYLAADMLERQARRTSELRRDMARLRLQTAEGRFMHYLLTENRFDRNGQTLLDGYFHEIALRLNLAPATLSRTLADLQRRGSIYRKGRRLTLRKSISPKPIAESKRVPATTSLG